MRFNIFSVTFSHKILKDTPLEKANMSYSSLCLPTRFNKKEMKKAMENNTFHVTILSDLMAVFESYLGYYKLEKQFEMSLGYSMKTFKNSKEPFHRVICCRYPQ